MCVCVCVCVSSETYEMPKKAFDDTATSRTQAFKWYSLFRSGWTLFEGLETSDDPLSRQTDKSSEKMHKIIHEDRRQTINKICNIPGLSIWYMLMHFTWRLKHDVNFCKICDPCAEWQLETKPSFCLAQPARSGHKAHPNPLWILCVFNDKNQLKWQKLEDIVEIQAEMQALLDSIMKMEFQRSF